MAALWPPDAAGHGAAGRYDKRYQDIDDVLDAGIDVISTVNVQHLESLNDRVAELTGVRVRETPPDAVLGTADRGGADRPHARGTHPGLREGRIYPPERARAALNCFFKVENLGTLRELALRQVAKEVEAKRGCRCRRSATRRAPGWRRRCRPA